MPARHLRCSSVRCVRSGDAAPSPAAATNAAAYGSRNNGSGRAVSIARNRATPAGVRPTAGNEDMARIIPTAQEFASTGGALSRLQVRTRVAPGALGALHMFSTATHSDASVCAHPVHRLVHRTLMAGSPNDWWRSTRAPSFRLFKLAGQRSTPV